MQRKPKIQTFPDLVEETVAALVAALETPVLVCKCVGHLWRPRAKSAIDKAAELKPWIEMQRERDALRP